MFIYVVSTATNKVLTPHETEFLKTELDFFERGVRLLVKLNELPLPTNIEVFDCTASHCGIEISGCKLFIKQAKYCILIQGLTSTDFVHHCGSVN